MNISFCIPLAPNYETATLQKLVNSIQYQAYTEEDKYEIILCGEYRDDIKTRKDVIKHIPFDESVKHKWITKKKNDIVDAAQYPNICILHDYYELGPSWFNSIHRCEDWDVLCNPILTFEGERHSDWLVNQKYMDKLLARYPKLEEELLNAAPGENNGARRVCGLPYKERGLTHIQYVSGGYIFAKKQVFTDVPFDESIAWGEAAEDIIWSESVIDKKFKIRFNPYSNLRLQKPGKWRLYRMTDNAVARLKEMFPSELSETSDIGP